MRRLAAGKNLEEMIKNPIRYRAGNFNKMSAESFAGSFCRTLIFNMLTVNRRLAIDQVAPTSRPNAHIVLCDSRSARAPVMIR